MNFDETDSFKDMLRNVVIKLFLYFWFLLLQLIYMTTQLIIWENDSALLL